LRSQPNPRTADLMHAPHDKSRSDTAAPPAEEKQMAGSLKRWVRSEGMVIALAFGAIAFAGLAAWWTGSGAGANAQKGPPVRAVSVFAGNAVRKDMPYRVEAIGTVQPVVSLAVRSRVDSQVEKVHFEDGATVKTGDILFTLDSRSIDAQISQAQATIARDQAQLEKALRDVDRIQGLVDKNTVGAVQLADARTAADVLKATVAQNQAQLQRAANDAAVPLATVNQLSPIYVAFGLPERYIPDLRTAGDKVTVEATLQSEVTVGGGKVAFIDNTVDPQTGTIMARASFDNKDERLWPGTLASIRVTLRVDPDVVAVPAEAVQNGQAGTFVFVIENGVAKVRPVSVTRTQGGEAIIGKGLTGNETVVTDGQLSLRDGSRVDVKRRAGA
jgi:multidrug efflux system membrane fusion protein